MSGFNGSGTFNISGIGLPYVSGTTISSSVANTLNTELAAGLSTCILKDGTQTIAANIPWSNYKITGLGTGTASADAASVYNIQCSTGTYVSVTGTDTIVGTVTPALTSGYVTGMTYRFFAAGTNTGAVTLDINTQGAKAVTKNGTVALSAGDIPVGVLITVTYDGTRFVLNNQTTFASLTTATLTVTGNTTIGGNATVSGKTLFTGGNVLSANTFLSTLATKSKVPNGVMFIEGQASVNTTLGAGITATDLSIPLTSTVGFPTGGATVVIDNEQITYSSISAGSLIVSSTANRGVNGTTAAAHNITAAVSCLATQSTTVSGTIDSIVTTIPVASTAGFPNSGTIIINNEQISYTGITSTSFTGATRGVNGTTAASATGSLVLPVQFLQASSNFKYDSIAKQLTVPNLAVTNLSISGTSNITNAATFSQKIQPITASTVTPVSGALNVTLNPTVLDFRDTTLTSGTVSTVQVTSPITLRVDSGATLGSVTNYAFRLIVLAMNNAGTVELAIVNSLYDKRLNETDRISTTTLSGSSNSATTIYSTTGRSNLTYKVIGFIDFPAGTAGTWATITEVQGSNDQVACNLTNPLTRMIVQNASSAPLTFSNIPTEVKRITIVFNKAVLTSADYLVQIGSGSTTTSGYVSNSSRYGAAAANAVATNGFVVSNNSASTTNGTMTLFTTNGSDWISSHHIGCYTASTSCSSVGGGAITLSGILDRVIVTSTSGTPSSGTITVMYE